MFIEEFSKVTGLPINEILMDYTITNVGGKVVSITNYQKLLTYLPDKIVLKIKNNELTIEGTNLKIVELSQKNIIIKGAIFKSYLLKEISDNGTIQ